MTTKLLTPVKLGVVDLPNRVVMAPLTRSRAGQPGDVPTELNAEYYAQRASAGLIVSEGAVISGHGRGYAWTPGIHTAEQEAGWRRVIDRVHAVGGRISAQLWHVGRISCALLQDGGGAPLAPSAIKAENTKCFPVFPDGRAAFVACDAPRALETDELAGIIGQYRSAAERALRSGFDMVEVHSANGYLLNQFLATNTNRRVDRYGGSLENRARLTLDVVDAVAAVMGAGRVGVRLSPHFRFNDLDDAETESMTLYLASQFSHRHLAYLHIAEPGWVGGSSLTDAFRRKIREAFNGALILCGGFDVHGAERVLAEGLADAVAFGRPYIANPDLVARIRTGAAWREPDRATFYGGGAAGYTDYPALP